MNKEPIIVNDPRTVSLIFHIKGITPYISSALTMETVEGIYKTGSNPKEISAKELNRIYDSQIYKVPGTDKPAIPGSAFFKACSDAASGKGWFKGKQISGKSFRGAVSVDTDFIEIHGNRVDRIDVGKLKGSTPKIIYRPSFVDWECFLPVSVNVDILSIEDAVNIISVAGRSIGIGCWRPDKKGVFGKFKIGGVENA